MHQTGLKAGKQTPELTFLTIRMLDQVHSEWQVLTLQNLVKPPYENIVYTRRPSYQRLFLMVESYVKKYVNSLFIQFKYIM